MVAVLPRLITARRARSVRAWRSDSGHGGARLAQAASFRDTSPTLVVTGSPGVGKTEFGLQVAQRLVAGHEVCQLYAELGGSTGHPADPAEVLGQFLSALGADIDGLPSDCGYRSNALRTWTAGRRVLIMLDDVASVRQARAHMPSSPGCAVVVTGTYATLHTLATTSVRLAPLALSDAVDMLAQLAGPERVCRERAAAEELCEMCGRIPLALQSVSAKLMASPTWSLSSLVRSLADETSRLRALSHGDLDLFTRIDACYWQLETAEKSACGCPACSVPRA